MLLLRNVEALARKGQVLETGKGAFPMFLPALDSSRPVRMSADEQIEVPTDTEPQIATVLRECIEGLDKVWKESGWPVLVVGTTSDADKVPLGILACFKRDIAVEVGPRPS